MTHREPSWMAGYLLATSHAAPPVIVVPLEYDECQRMDFVTGCLVGARDARAAALMDAMKGKCHE